MPRTIPFSEAGSGTSQARQVAPSSGALTTALSVPTWTEPNDLAAAVLGQLRREFPARLVSYTAVHNDLATALRQRPRSAQLHVVGAHLPGSDLAGGRHGERAHAACPVVIYRAGQPLRGPVLLALEGDGRRHDVTEYAIGEAARLRVPLRAVHVWIGSTDAGFSDAATDADKLLADVLAAHPARHGDVSVERQILHDADAATALIRLSAQGSVLVVGSRSRAAAETELIGSTTAMLLGRTRCPLVVLPDHPSGAPA